MKLVLDHHYPAGVAIKLREFGRAVLSAQEQGWESEDDESLLVLCGQERAALLTNNVGDFVIVAQRWAAEGRSHSGLIFTSDVSMPRNRSSIGRYVSALEELLRANSAEDAFVERLHWL